MKKIVIGSLGAILVTTAAFAYEVHHPNLRDAYGAAEMAIQHIHEVTPRTAGSSLVDMPAEQSLTCRPPSTRSPRPTNGMTHTIGELTLSGGGLAPPESWKLVT